MFVLILSTLTYGLMAQQSEVYTMVERMPEFPGGETALFGYLASELRYPPDAKKQSIEGIVYCTFIIDELGNVKDARVIKGIGRDVTKQQ